jgi:glutathione synthase/RimK-type ligase-like ATP-grasp enzyme
MMDVALITCAKYLAPDPHNALVSLAIYEDALMVEHYARLGLTARRVDWADPAVDWSRVGRAVIRALWDYQDKPAAFTAWLDSVEGKTRIVNAPAVIRWNLDKRYLHDLERARVAVVPTLFVPDDMPLPAVFAHFGCDEIVVKPTISASGCDTFRVARGQDFAARFDALRAGKALMAQPFVPEILAGGEVSLIAIAGRVTHAVRKVPGPGGFLVQEEHGGATVPHAVTREEEAFAARVLAACPPGVIYARIDIVHGPDGPRVMEVEAFEPELFFRFHAPAARALAEAALGA